MRTSRILYVSLVFFFYMPYLTNRRPGFGAACSQIQGVEFQMDVLQEDAQESSLVRVLDSCNHKGEPVGSSRRMWCPLVSI